MPDSTIYCKTHKGVEEIALRGHQLASRLRSILILIDGRTPWDELCERVVIGEDNEHIRQTLLEEGYIQPLGDEPETVIEM